MLKFIFVPVFFIIVSLLPAQAQNFASQQKTLQATINSAYRAKKITAKEYGKLMEEQETIKYAIAKAQADNIMTPDEKNKINSKLIRSRKRLAKYRSNREVY